MELSGCLISTRSSDLERLIGIQEAGQLASSGHTIALVPDESLLALASLDIDLSPKMSFSKQSTVYLAYLWVVYKDALTGDYWPIYEYGNIANPRSYDLLLKMLLDRISFLQANRMEGY